MATGTKGLMLWCKKITANYGAEVEIKNMASSWKNGLAFCAILHHYRPDLIDFSKLSKENVAGNNALAFEVAENELGIPALLDVEDMVNMRVPDRLSIMTYVSQYYNYFRDKTPGEIITHRIPSKKRPLADKSEDIPAKVVATPGKLTIRNASEMPSPSKTSPNNCFSCGKTVYLMERLSVEGKLFHRVCFKCVTCGTQLKTSTYDFDRNQQKFYCEKHFRERGKVTDTKPEARDYSPKGLVNIQEDVAMNEESTTPSPISDSPFLRNEQLKKVRPQSSPAELDWERKRVIKSKKEEHKTPTKDANKTFLASVLKRKPHTSDSSEDRDFANPAYQQHLQLSNFMNQLESKTGDGSSSEPTMIDSKNSKTTIIEDPQKSPHKKKFVLKIKKKKKKKQEQGMMPDNEGDDAAKVLTEVDVVQKSKTKLYENIDSIAESKNHKINYQDDKVIYDNNLLCNVVSAHDDNSKESAESSLSEINERKEYSTLGIQEKQYSNLSEGNDEDKNENQQLLAARTKLRSSGRRKNDEADQNNTNAESKYVDIRSNLRKVKSTENVSTESNADNVGQTFLAARSKLHKTGLGENVTCVDGADDGNIHQKTPLKTDSSIEYMRDDKEISGTPLLKKDLVKMDLDSIPASVNNDKPINTADTENPFLTPEVSPEPSPTMLSESGEPNPFNDTPSASNLEQEVILNIIEDSPSNVDSTKPFEDSSIKEESTNPFEDWSDEESTSDIKTENNNPFLSSSEEDILFESDHSEEFDESNPFADDVKFERKNTIDKKKQQSLTRHTKERLSIKQKQDLKKIGIEESNPFADDVLDELDDDPESHQKLSKKVSIHVPNVKSHLPKAGNKKLVLKTKHGSKPQVRPISAPVPPSLVPDIIPVIQRKRRPAPKAPTAKIVESASASPTSENGTLKKRQAPPRPSILSDTNSEIESTHTDSIDRIVKNTYPASEIIIESSGDISGEVVQGKLNNSNSEQDQSLDNSLINRDIDVTSERDDAVLSNTTPKSSSTPTKPVLQKRESEKRKAPVRPLQPYKIDEDIIMKGVALRDKQPNRAEMEAELQYLETRQRELEMEGVVMEKKLRDCSQDEPEEAYLLTWFELVNQKNLLLRRENELIYLCQEQDFLRNQRHAEFELRQLMSKREDEKTMEDRMREDELLADILNFVTRRSHIVDQMDEDRLREYEEDKEINNMLESQGLKSPSKQGIPVETKDIKMLKEKDSKEKTKKKEKVKNKQKMAKNKKS